MQTMEELDKKYIWHPFTQMKQWVAAEQTTIVRAKGNMLYDQDGNAYYDAVSSLWVNIHGHQRPEIDEAIIAQLQQVAHSTSLGLANVPASRLAEMLIARAPRNLEKVFYSDDGATAVEIALKMAFQYWQIKGKTQKQKFITLANAYHGDTIGAVSVGGIDLFHQVYQPLLFPAYHVPSPSCYHCGKKDTGNCSWQCLEALEAVLKEHSGEIAAMIIEPLVQAAAGMLMSPQGYLKRVRELTRKYDVLLIADEVAVGFGRTGKLFACENEEVEPDFMCLSKGITGGYMPLAATLTSLAVYEAFLGDPGEGKTFYHGHSYTGNQLACAAGVASLEIFDKEHVLEGLQEKIAAMKAAMDPFKALTHVGDVRQQGMIAGIELMADKQKKQPYEAALAMGGEACRCARKYGLFIRPVGDVIVFMPPLCSSAAEIRDMLALLLRAVTEVTENGERNGADGGLF